MNYKYFVQMREQKLRNYGNRRGKTNNCESGFIPMYERWHMGIFESNCLSGENHYYVCILKKSLQKKKKLAKKKAIHILFEFDNFS